MTPPTLIAAPPPAYLHSPHRCSRHKKGGRSSLRSHLRRHLCRSTDSQQVLPPTSLGGRVSPPPAYLHSPHRCSRHKKGGRSSLRSHLRRHLCRSTDSQQVLLPTSLGGRVSPPPPPGSILPTPRYSSR